MNCHTFHRTTLAAAILAASLTYLPNATAQGYSLEEVVVTGWSEVKSMLAGLKAHIEDLDQSLQQRASDVRDL